MPLPSGQITTFSELAVAWHGAERESDKRAVWRTLARGGWLCVCRDAVQRSDQTTLEAWLDASDSIRQDVIQFNGTEAAHMVRTYLLCALFASRTRELTWRERHGAVQEGIATLSVPLGFCSDLIREFLAEPLRRAEQELSLTVLLIDTPRNDGVAAILTLALLPDGSEGLYPVPALAFIRDPDFCRAAEAACTWVKQVGLWREGYDVCWWLQRRDGRPLSTLTGPSLGAAFALGLGKLFT